MWRTGTRAPHRNNRQPAILCTGQRGPGSGPPIMVTYRRSKAARTPTTASTRHHATKTFNQWKTSYTAQCLSTGRLKQGTAKNLLRHRTAQAGDGMHAEHGRIPSRRHRHCFFLASTEPEPEPESEPEPKKQYPDRVNRVANRSSKCPQTYGYGRTWGRHVATSRHQGYSVMTGSSQRQLDHLPYW